MKNSETGILSLFEGGCEGEETMSDHTPRTQSTGDMSVASVAGESSNTLREEEFRALMEGEYKDLFTAYFQQTFNRRFKEYKQIKCELEESRTVLDAVHERFGDLVGDALLNAIRAETVSKNAPTEAEMPVPATRINGVAQDEIDKACAEAERRLLAHIRARGMRPAENALCVQSTCDTGVMRMTREERAELARRAERGERIVL